MEHLEITEENKDTILELFDKDVDDDGHIIEKATGAKLICPYTEEPVKKDDFSILPGSSTFVNNDPTVFVEHIVDKETNS